MKAKPAKRSRSETTVSQSSPPAKKGKEEPEAPTKSVASFVQGFISTLHDEASRADTPDAGSLRKRVRRQK